MCFKISESFNHLIDYFFMLAIYDEIIYRPLLNLLVWGYNTLPGHDIGIVIILLTLLIRVILAPLLHKSLKHQERMTAIQPLMNEIREKFKDDKEKQAKALMDLYQEHQISPFSSCLPLLIQLPILIALYQVFNTALKGNLDGLYTFVSRPEFLNPKFLGFIDLSHSNAVFAIVSGLLQFWQSKMMMASNANQSGSDDPTTKALMFQTTYLLPIISVFIAWNLPAGLPLYWIVTTLFGIGQQYYIRRSKKD